MSATKSASTGMPYLKPKLTTVTLSRVACSVAEVLRDALGELVDVEVGGVDDEVGVAAEARPSPRARAPARRAAGRRPAAGAGAGRPPGGGPGRRRWPRGRAGWSAGRSTCCWRVASRRASKNEPERTSTTTAIGCVGPAAVVDQPDHVAHQGGRQVVDDEEAEVLELLGGRAAPGAGHAGDDDQLAGLRGRSLGHQSSSISPVAVLTRIGCAGPVLRVASAAARAALIAFAVLGPMPGTRGDLVDVGRAQLPERAEVLEQRLAAHLAQPGDVVEEALDHRLRPAAAVVGDGEAVRLVAHPLQEVEPLAGARQDDRVLLAGQPDLLEPLGQAADRDVVDAELVERLLGGRDLRRAAVDDDQAGRVGELARPTRVRVDEQRPVLVRRRPRSTSPARRAAGGTGG